LTLPPYFVLDGDVSDADLGGAVALAIDAHVLPDEPPAEDRCERLGS
jgi:hypothetical protein